MKNFYTNKYTDPTNNTCKIYVNKQQLLSPELKKYISESSEQPFIYCSDFDLSFYGEDYKNLLNLYEEINNKVGTLRFSEKIFSGIEYKKDDNHYDARISQLYFDFLEIIEANLKFQRFANKVNKGYKNEAGEYVQYSPYEKFIICSNYINGFKYHCTSNSLLSDQSFIATATKLTGCCLGKAQALKFLLNMVGIDSSTLIVDVSVEEYRRYERENKNNPLLKIISKYSSYTNAIKNSNIKFGGIRVNHAINLVYIDDDKYNIHGVLGCDISGNNNFSLIDKFAVTDAFSLMSFTEFNNNDTSDLIARHINLENFFKDKKNSDRLEELLNKHFKEMKSYLSLLLSPYNNANNPGIDDFIKYLKKSKDFYSLYDFALYKHLYGEDEKFKIEEHNYNKVKEILDFYICRITDSAASQVTFEAMENAYEAKLLDIANNIIEKTTHLSFGGFNEKPLTHEDYMSK